MLDFERVRPYDKSLTAPLRLDCALTYRLPPGADPISAPSKRVTRSFPPRNGWVCWIKPGRLGFPT